MKIPEHAQRSFLRYLNISPETSQRVFARFVGSAINGFPEISANAYPQSTRQPPVENDIFEERVATMMYDGGLSEAEAIRYLVANLPYADLTTE